MQGELQCWKPGAVTHEGGFGGLESLARDLAKLDGLCSALVSIFLSLNVLGQTILNWTFCLDFFLTQTATQGADCLLCLSFMVELGDFLSRWTLLHHFSQFCS